MLTLRQVSSACLLSPGLTDGDPGELVVAAEGIYVQLVEAGFEVLLDDRNIRPGVMFNDMELIGIPHRVVVGERGLDDGVLEYRRRTASENESLPLEGAVGALLEKVAAA